MAGSSFRNKHPGYLRHDFSQLCLCFSSVEHHSILFISVICYSFYSGIIRSVAPLIHFRQEALFKYACMLSRILSHVLACRMNSSDLLKLDLIASGYRLKVEDGLNLV